jgi:imidazolonepropionase-like amidohydrolase
MPADAATSRETRQRAEETAIMSKPAKTEAELVAMARAELKVHADCPDGIKIFVLAREDSWEFRTEADEATKAKPGYPECVAMIVQIGDHLSKQFDAKG